MNSPSFNAGQRAAADAQRAAANTQRAAANAQRAGDAARRAAASAQQGQAASRVAQNDRQRPQRRAGTSLLRALGALIKLAVIGVIVIVAITLIVNQ